MKFFFNCLAHAFLWLLAHIPYRWTVHVGYFLARLAPRFSKSRVKVIAANLRACFPQMSESEREQIQKEHWRLLGRSFAERGILWLGSEQQITELVEVQSAVNLADGKPRLYVGMHMVGIEAGLIAISLHLKKLGVKPGITLYIHMTNDYFEPRIKAWRERFGARMLLREHHGRELIRVGMPHVLWELQGERKPVFEEREEHGHKVQVFTGKWEQVKPGTMTPQQYDQAVGDLVNYLQWMGEPAQNTRVRVGVWVLLFLLCFTFIAWRLNAAFWKDVK